MTPANRRPLQPEPTLEDEEDSLIDAALDHDTEKLAKLQRKIEAKNSRQAYSQMMSGKVGD